jgi:hypothetical protein
MVRIQLGRRADLWERRVRDLGSRSRVDVATQLGGSGGHRQRFERRERPRTVEDLRTWLVKPYDVISAFHDREVVRQAGIAAEVNRHGAVVARLGGDAADRVAAQVVLLEEPAAVVDADRPECPHRHVCDGDLIMPDG